MACVVVLATPRTGSSMVAGIVHSLGFSMGDDLLPADRWNQQGYFEDRQLLLLHRALSFPTRDEERIRLRLPAKYVRLSNDQKQRYARAIKARASAGKPWGVKDPRLVFLFEHFHGLVEEPIKLIVTRRDQAESISSLAAMFDLGSDDAETVVDAYEERRRDVLEGYRGQVLEVTYATAVGDPGKTVKQIAEFLEVPTTPAALSVINPSLRRHFA